MAMIDKVFIVGMALTILTGPMMIVLAPAWACFILEMKMRQNHAAITERVLGNPDSAGIMLFGDGF